MAGILHSWTGKSGWNPPTSHKSCFSNKRRRQRGLLTLKGPGKQGNKDEHQGISEVSIEPQRNRLKNPNLIIPRMYHA